MCEQVLGGGGGESEGMLPRKIFENLSPQIAGNTPNFYNLVHIFQTIFPPRNSTLNVDQL